MRICRFRALTHVGARIALALRQVFMCRKAYGIDSKDDMT